MSLPYPDNIVHNSTKSDQLKQNVTTVYVISEGLDYLLIDDTNIGNSSGWDIYWNQGVSTYNSLYANIDGSNIDWTAGYTTYDVRYAKISGVTFTGSVMLNHLPLLPLEAATKSYVDANVTGLIWKQAVLVMSLSDLTLSGEQTVNSVVLITGDRILVNGQTDQTENGVYLVDSGAWTRTTDGDSGAELVSAAFLIGSGDDTNPNTQWVCGNPSPITIGVTNIFFNQLGGVGSYSAGTGLDLAGTVFSIPPNAVDFSLFQNVSANVLIGNPNNSGGNIQEITLGGELSFIGDVLTNTLIDVSQLNNDAGYLDQLTGFAQGGNTFGQEGILGTFDAFDLGFYVSASLKMNLNNSTGRLDLVNGLTIPVTTTSDIGVIYQDNFTLLHTYGTDCTFLGVGAGNFTFTGTENLGIGTVSLASLTTGSFNTGVGPYTLNSVTTATQCTALGYIALANNTTGTFNTAFGSQAMFVNTTGIQNTAIGPSALKNNTTGNNNSAFGASALLSNTTGVNNAALGLSALRFNTTGGHNFGIGTNALRNNVLGSNNVAIGDSAGFGVLSNSYSNNVFIGDASGVGVTTGSNNVFLGYNSGSNVTTGSNDILIGYNLSILTATTNNYMSIGNIIFGTGINGTGTTISSALIGIGNNAPTNLLTVGKAGYTGDTFIFIDNLSSFYVENSAYLFVGGRGGSQTTFQVIHINEDSAGLTLGSFTGAEGNGVYIYGTGSTVTDSNVIKKNRGIIAGNHGGGVTQDGLHIWQGETGKSIIFWDGSDEATAIQTFEIGANFCDIKNAVVKSGVITPTTSNVLFQVPDNIATVLCDKLHNLINLPLNPLIGQEVNFDYFYFNAIQGNIVVTATSPKTLFGLTTATFPATSTSGGTTLGMKWRYVATNKWLRIY